MKERNRDDYRRAIRQALSTLSERERQIVMLSSDGTSTREIANQFGISINTVRTYKAKFRKRVMADLHFQIPAHCDDTDLETQKIPEPPKNAELLLTLFLRRDEQEAAIGCFSEIFAKKVQRLGKRRAVIWAWCDVLRTLWPVIKRMFVRVSGLAATVEWLRRHFS